MISSGLGRGEVNEVHCASAGVDPVLRIWKFCSFFLHEFCSKKYCCGWIVSLQIQNLRRWPYLEMKLCWERVGSFSNMKVVVPLLSRVWLCDHVAAAHQASLYFTVSRSLLKLMSIESVMLSNRLILHHALLLLHQSFFPSTRFFSNGSWDQVTRVLNGVLIKRGNVDTNTLGKMPYEVWSCAPTSPGMTRSRE